MTTTNGSADTFTIGAMLGPGEIELRSVPVPAPGAGEALIRIEATAICTWEQRSFSGQQANKFPFVGGHEIVGSIVEFGPGYFGPLKPGDRVATGSSACGACHWCLTGQDRGCKEHYAGSVSYGDAWGPGGFAQMKIHRADGLFYVGEAAAETAALVEPLSCALHSTRLADVGLGDDVVVIGAGVMGLLNVIASKKRGARVIVSEVDARRLDKAREIGADHVIDASATDPVARVKELTDGRGATVVIAAIGHPKANEQGMAMLAVRGTFVLFASAHPQEPLELLPNQVHNDEHRVIGVVSSEKQDFYSAAQLIRLNQVDLSPLLESTYELDNLKDALDEAILPGKYRVIVKA